MTIEASRLPELPAAPAAGSAGERLLHRLRPHRSRRHALRERRVELAFALAFALVATLLAWRLPSERHAEPLIAIGLTAAYAAASRVRLYVGAGYAAPTQLVLLPMLFWLPIGLVPGLVAAGLVLAGLGDVVRGGRHPERLVSAVADAWYAVAPVAVLAVAGQPDAGEAAVLVIVAAFVAQCALDLVSGAAREWLGRGIAPAVHVRVMAEVYGIDACLTPIAALAAAAAFAEPVIIGALLALLALLRAFAADRSARIEEATRRLDELEAERRRVRAAIGRVGEAFAAQLDGPALIRQGLTTAAEAVDAPAGRVVAGPVTAAAFGDGAAAEVLAAAEAAARGSSRRSGSAARDGWYAMASRLPSGERRPGPAHVLSLARADRPFTDDDQALVGHLATQIAVAVENAALHEQVTREATTDALTGLANHRRLRGELAVEVERTHRFGRDVALVMLDVDHFKAVNDQHGHPQGDEVLRRVARAVRDRCRAGDLAARYGGEEFAVLLPGTDLAGARAAAEAMRRAVESLEIPLATGGTLRVTVSVGVAAVGHEGGDADGLVAAADAALYDAKRGGRNRTVTAAAHASSAASERRFSRADRR